MRKNVAVGRSSDRDGDGFEPSSDFDGRIVYGVSEGRSFGKDGRAVYDVSEGRSFSKEVAFGSSLDSDRWGCDGNEEERAADLRNMNRTSKGKAVVESVPLSSSADQICACAPDANARTSSERHQGGSFHHEQQSSFKIPEFASPPRNPELPQKDSIAGMTTQQVSGTPKPKPKHGRPYKYTTSELMQKSKEQRDFYTSQRRLVTEFEIDEAHAAAHSFADHLDGTHFVLTMCQTFVYRYFIMVSSKFLPCAITSL